MAHKSLRLRIVSAELAPVKNKWREIGTHLGISKKQFKQCTHPEWFSDPVQFLIEILHFWLKGNTGVSPTWESVVKALESAGEWELSLEVELKYCQSVRDTYGRHPSIAINNKSVVVEVHEESLPDGEEEKKQPKVYYRVCEAKFEGKKMKWKNDEPQLYNERGYRPRVAINNQNIVVAVCESADHLRCYYRVGYVKQESGNIVWGTLKQNERGVHPDKEFGEGQTECSLPGVAINDNNTVILTYCSGEDKNKTTYYKVGSIDTKEMKIKLSESKTIPNVTCITNLTIALNNDGKVVTAFRRGDTLYCNAGKLKGPKDDVIWEDGRTKIASHTDTYKPDYPVVSINSKGYYVVVFSSFQNLSTGKDCEMTCNVGSVRSKGKNECEIVPLKDEEIMYGIGWYPAVAIDDENRVIEIHEVCSAVQEGQWQPVKLNYQFLNIL